MLNSCTGELCILNFEFVGRVGQVGVRAARAIVGQVGLVGLMGLVVAGKNDSYRKTRSI